MLFGTPSNDPNAPPVGYESDSDSTNNWTDIESEGEMRYEFQPNGFEEPWNVPDVDAFQCRAGLDDGIVQHQDGVVHNGMVYDEPALSSHPQPHRPRISTADSA
jgi:hypothetical protein